MTTPQHNKTFLPLFATNFLGVFNDNFLKTLASFVVIGWLADGRAQSVVMGAIAGALVLPFILFSPLADRLTVVFSKCRVLRMAKWAEIPIVALGVVGFATHTPTLVIAAVLLMGLQSALYSPSKYALVRDIGGVSRISIGMGGMEGIAFLAMLAGTVVASWAVDHAAPAVRYVVLLGVALVGLAASYGIRAREEPNRAVHAINPYRYLTRAYRMAKRYDGLNDVILTLSVFWWAAAMLQMGLLVYGKQVLGLDATHTGLTLALAAVGIVSGQVLAGYVDGRVFLLGFVPVTGFVGAALLAVAFFAPLNAVAFSVVVALLAFDFGFFKLPLDAEIQRVVKGPRLNTMLAYFNQVSFLFMLTASVVYALVSALWGPRAFLLVLALVMAATSATFAMRYRVVFSFLGKWIFAQRYRVTVSGADVFAQIAEDGRHGHLILPNHPAMVDPMLVMAELWRTPVRPLCDELYFDQGGLAARVLKTVGAIKVPDLRRHRTAAGAQVVRGLQDVVIDALAEGKSVLFYPSGHIWTEPHEDIGTRQLAYNVCKALPPETRVIGVRTSGLWGSMWSRKGRKSTPPFVPTLIKGVLLWPVSLVLRRQRLVTMHFEDITMRVREAANLTRLEFNRQLEAWYNAE